MGYDVEIAVEENSLAPELLCPICTGIIESPVRTPCSHLFCQGCINLWFDRSHDCPQCRTVITASSATVDRLLKNIVGATKVKCVKFKEGCTWVGKLDDMASHKCSLCACVNCPYKLESENKAKQIRELKEKCKSLEAKILRISRASPPIVSPSLSFAPPPPSQSSSSSSSPIQSISPAPIRGTSPPSQPPRVNTSGSNSHPYLNAPLTSPSLASSPFSSAPNPSQPHSNSHSITLTSSSQSPPAPSSSPVSTRVANLRQSLACNNCLQSEATRYTYYRCSDCPGQHHKAKQEYYLCAPCFLIYPPVHVGRFSKME
jgi:hypothetical protein